MGRLGLLTGSSVPVSLRLWRGGILRHGSYRTGDRCRFRGRRVAAYWGTRTLAVAPRAGNAAGDLGPWCPCATHRSRDQTLVAMLSSAIDRLLGPDGGMVRYDRDRGRPD